MATKQQSLIPLIDIQSAAFAEQYECGDWWSMHGDEQGKEPVPASYPVTNLKQYAERGYFEQHTPSSPPSHRFLSQYVSWRRARTLDRPTSLRCDCACSPRPSGR
jgi:hypothetical protein